jgi:hypothetical protein
MKKAMEIGSFDEAIRKNVAMELEPSWPVPVENFIVFFYFARFGPPPAQVDQLYPPSWVASLSPEDGRVLNIEKKDPAYFGISGQPDKPFAQHAYPSDWTPDSIMKMKARLFECMDILYPEWISNRAPDGRSAPDFRTLFPEMAAPPMMVCYRHISPRFFSWAGV